MNKEPLRDANDIIVGDDIPTHDGYTGHLAQFHYRTAGEQLDIPKYESYFAEDYSIPCTLGNRALEAVGSINELPA
jgi:hypothetical protein